MTLKQQKIISLVWASAVILGSLEALTYIYNLYQPSIYLHLAVVVGIYITLHITFLYDLHFKRPAVYACSRVGSGHGTFTDRIKCDLGILKQYLVGRGHHFRYWRYIRHWILVLGLPWLLYWATVAVIFLHFRRTGIQQLFVVFSSVSLSVIFWHLKEIFQNRGENVSKNSFAVLQVAKLYTAYLIFAAGFGLASYFCLGPVLYGLVVFGGIFTLMFQSLFHMQKLNPATISAILGLAVAISLCAIAVFVYWGLNYFTAGLFLMGIYNFFWGLYYHHAQEGLTLRIFWEFLLVTAVIVALSFGITNFRARILPYC